MAKKKLLAKFHGEKGAQERENKREERRSHGLGAIQARWTKKTNTLPNTTLEERYETVAGPSTSTAAEMDIDKPIPMAEMPFDMDFMAPVFEEVVDERQQQIKHLGGQLKERDDTIEFLRQQLRNREAMITSLRQQLDAKKVATPPANKTTPPNRGRPRKSIDQIQRSSRRSLADQLFEVLDRDRSRSASRCALERVHREVRHKFNVFTPLKKVQPQKDQREPMDATDALLVLCLVGTQKMYRRLKSTLRLIDPCYDVLPPLTKVLAIKRRICAALRYETVALPSVGVGFYCADLVSALEFRFAAARNNLLNFGNAILLKISGDHGQGFTKITVSLGHALRPNSPSNNFVAAVFPAKDSRENLERFCGTLWQQIDQIRSLHGKKVLWFLGGDVSFLWAMTGHLGSARTIFPSPVCTISRDHLIDTEEMCHLRTVPQSIEYAKQFKLHVETGERTTAVERSATKGIISPPLLRGIEFDRIILAPFHVFQGLGNALIKELEQDSESAEIAGRFFRSINVRREAFRKKDLTGNSVRKILVRAKEMAQLFDTGRAKSICMALDHLGKIQAFSKAQPLSPQNLDDLEERVDEFKAFLSDQPQIRNFLAQKPKVHLLLTHFVPFARRHQFLGLLDEQGDEALHSVWRRLEQLWKTMPDQEQMRQQLEHHFVSNWLMDTGKIDDLKLSSEEQRQKDEEENEEPMDDAEADEDGFVDVELL